jgi:hypothetical protein
MNAIPREADILDFLALALASRLSVFGRGAADARHRRITRRQLAQGRFTGGAASFVIDSEGLVFTDLRVRRADLD